MRKALKLKSARVTVTQRDIALLRKASAGLEKINHITDSVKLVWEKLYNLQTQINTMSGAVDVRYDEILTRIGAIVIPDPKETKAFELLNNRLDVVFTVANQLQESYVKLMQEQLAQRPPAEPAPPLKGGWINVYDVDPNGHYDLDTAQGPFCERGTADAVANSDRIACIELPDIIRGHGLDQEHS